MSDQFKFSQGNVDQIQYARLIVPGTGRSEKDDAPIIIVEREGDMLTLFVYADIKSKEATHEIPLNGALLTKKAQGVTSG